MERLIRNGDVLTNRASRALATWRASFIAFLAEVITTIKMSSFFFNHGYHPRISFTYESRTGKDPRQKAEFKQAESIARQIEAALEKAKKNLKAAQESIVA